MEESKTCEGGTRYPIVLVHGVTLAFAKIGSLEYFNGLRPKLEREGFKVYLPAISTSTDLSENGDVLIRKLKDIQKASGDKKFNLIAHGPSGVSARFAASVRPDLVASVTTVGTGNYGENTDAIFLPFGKFRFLIYKMGDVAAKLIHKLQGEDELPINTRGLVESGNYSGMKAFNALHPQGMHCENNGGDDASLAENGVHYFSMCGNRPFTNVFNPLSYVFAAAEKLEYGSNESDGITAVASARWGKVIRDDYPWNYFDEVNLFTQPSDKTAPNPVDEYVKHVRYLIELGL